VANVRKRLAVSKQAMNGYYMHRFNLKKLNEVEGKEQYRVEISDRFAALENVDTEVDINRARETLRENIKISAEESLGYYELKKHKPWFDEGCSELLYQRNFVFFLICIVGGGIKVHSTLRPLNGLLCQPRVIMIMEKVVK
jgi:hypothetical protein